ncbi:hypothetical protein [Patulibacter defluvii]|uniref:hypothetical protein n=1 Tax=Patulibacter defluvii TaxID=3095358 RepID=UPI002A765D67|nr:hypothetical protein [Patulibacter sp. DM4]
MSNHKHQIRFTTALAGALAAVALLPAAGASAARTPAGTLSAGAPRPSVAKVCWDDLGGYGCENEDGSGYHCDQTVDGKTLGCIRWDGDGNVSEL